MNLIFTDISTVIFENYFLLFSVKKSNEVMINKNHSPFTIISSVFFFEQNSDQKLYFNTFTSFFLQPLQQKLQIGQEYWPVGNVAFSRFKIRELESLLDLDLPAYHHHGDRFYGGGINLQVLPHCLIDTFLK